MTEAKHPLLLTRTLPLEGGSQVVQQYQIGKLMTFGSTDRMNKVRLLWSALEPQQIGKQFYLTTLPNRQEYKANIRQLVKQTTFLKALPHSLESKILNLHAIWSDQNNVYTVFEDCSYGSLSGLLNYCKMLERPMDGSHILYFLKKILETVSELHKNKIIHGNIKAEHVMIDSNMQVKLRGFGVYSQDEKMRKGTSYYMPPENIPNSKSQYTERSEVWSLGILTYYMFDTIFPFNVRSTQGKLFKDKQKELYEFIQNQQISLDQFTPQTPEQQDIKGLIQSMLTKKVGERITIDQLVHLDCFTKIGQREKDIQGDIFKSYRLYLRDLRSHQWIFPIKKQMIEVQTIPRQYKKVRVVKVLNLKVGFFFKLSNETVVAYFNDHTILSSTDKRSKDLIPNLQIKQKYLLAVMTKYFPPQFPISLDYFGELQKWDPECSISKLFFKDNFLFVRLTNETIEVFTFEKEVETEQQMKGQFNICITMNHNDVDSKEVLWQRGEEKRRFSSFEEALNNENTRKYFDHIYKCFKMMHQNCQISLKAAETNKKQETKTSPNKKSRTSGKANLDQSVTNDEWNKMVEG